MRTYEQTHPWINFEVRLELPQLALLLGEAKSKCEHISIVPLLPETAAEMHRLYLAKGALATTAIEGNTLTEDEVLQHLEGKLELPPSKEYLATEIDNIVRACNLIADSLVAGGDSNLTRVRICEFNEQVLHGLTLGEGVAPGQVRNHPVVVARYRGAPYEDCEYLLDRLCEWLRSPELNPPAGERGMGPVFALIRAILAHLYLAWIHPFGDGNGRTARLVEFQILVSAGLPSPAAHLLSNHYNQTRTEYYRQLDAASRGTGDVVPFLTYAVQGFVDGIRAQIEKIRLQQWDMTWRDYVHDKFREIEGATGSSQTEKRRRHLVLDLSARDQPVSLNELSLLSPRVAREYARKTAKTLTRDLNTLMAMGLLERSAAGFGARKDTIIGLLARRRNAP